MASSSSSSSSTSTNTAGYDSPTKATALVSSTPWKQIVAGFGDADSIEDKADIKAADDEGFLYSAVDASKRHVWNKQSSEPIEVMEPVMGADSWPALSDIAKVSLKSSVESPKSTPEPSVPLSPGNGPSPTSQKVTNSSHHNSVQNHANTMRQKSFKRHGGHASGNNGNSSQPLPPPSLGQFATVPSNSNAFSSQKNISLESGQKFQPESQSHGTIDRPRHSNPHRKLNGNHQHGDTSNNHRFGARRDHDRPNREWNSQKSFNGRDVRPQGTGVFPSGNISNIPMPHDSAPFMAPPLSPVMRPYASSISYPEFPFYYVPFPPESLRGMNIAYPAPAPPHLLMQYLGPEVYPKIIYQIDYYFSNDNLIKDIFLRKNMDEEGWVPIKLIAGFKKVKSLTDNIALITEAIRSSTVVEVKDDKVRRRIDWKKWIMPEPLRIPSQSTHLDPGSSSELPAGIHKMNLNGESSDIQSPTPPSIDLPLPHPSH